MYDRFLAVSHDELYECLALLLGSYSELASQGHAHCIGKGAIPSNAVSGTPEQWVRNW